MSQTLTFQVAVDEATTAEAARVLDERGWSVSDVIRVLLTRIATEQVIPLTPNPETIEAIEAGRRGEVARFDTVEALLADLHAEP